MLWICKSKIREKELTNFFFQEYINKVDYDKTRLLYNLKYALLLYQIEQTLDDNDFAGGLLDTIYSKLSNIYNHYPSSNDIDMSSKVKWLYGYTSNLKANHCNKLGLKTEAEQYYQKAAYLSPNLSEVSNIGLSFYADNYVLTGGVVKSEFYSDYITYLKQNGASKDKILSIWGGFAIENPITQKDSLRKYYQEIKNVDKMSFDSYWKNLINTGFKDAPMFAVKTIDGQLFDLSKKKGKWILLDFWGTWCGPCREEHPALNQFYKKCKEGKKNIDVITIACEDTLPIVQKYMLEKKFIFPIAMQQEKMDLVNIYPINVYPSKFLINPDGKYIFIPSNVDWLDFISKYVNM